ncbi:MAG: hypothetical protein HZB41_05865 [Ignavibacteriae bacterium]|nr:hypothetical protein [Ignavibacteriota bacterium]
MHTYNDVLESVEKFSAFDQLEIADIIRKRAIEERRNELKKEILQARKEFKSGKLKPKTVDEIIEELFH